MVNSKAMITRREKEVLSLVFEGLTTKEISVSLFISEHTVNTHCKNIMRKLGARNRTGLIRSALTRGLIVQPC